jgi:hypothetical protein
VLPCGSSRFWRGTDLHDSPFTPELIEPQSKGITRLSKVPHGARNGVTGEERLPVPDDYCYGDALLTDRDPLPPNHSANDARKLALNSPHLFVRRERNCPWMAKNLDVATSRDTRQPSTEAKAKLEQASG